MMIIHVARGQETDDFKKFQLAATFDLAVIEEVDVEQVEEEEVN